MNIYVLIIMVITLVAKLIGFARELVLSYFFGAGTISDAYLISLTIPGTLFQFVGTGLATSYIPIYLGLREKRKTKSLEFTNTIITCILFFSLILTVFVWLFGEQIVLLFASGFYGDSLKYAVLFTKINITSLFVATFVYVFTSYLQANEKVLWVQVSVIPYSITMLLSIILGATVNVLFLPLGSVCASIFQLVVLGIVVIKNGYKFFLCVKVRTEEFKGFCKILLPVIVGVSINDINILVDRTMASNIAKGAISALTYSYSLSMFIQGLFVQPIVNIYYPRITKLYESGEKKLFQKEIDEAVLNISFFLLPIVGYSIISAEKIVILLYGRGAFDGGATTLTVHAFWGYSIGFLMVGGRELFSRVFYATHNTKIPMINAAVGGIINIILNVVLSKLLGIFGLALATSVSAAITMFFLMYSMQKKQIYCVNSYAIKQIVKMVISVLCMILIVLLIRSNLNRLEEFVLLTVEILIGALVYIVVSVMMKIDFVLMNIKNIKKKIFK